ncbi:hypothetical protein CHH28_02230 [Bacterioplanes sanyensis]|uniref:Uncharacterized protein n=1 Tax=Bacterioplanes sanyensis TaxID=1249553 RepID=A0A222FG03_9GAMM|nr:hypothetical protein [Bacterioplanes sanyensis]ASP37562.1 hypothetical protein CHH28_02230 [Bacterioplanes sanyensis]
MPEPQEIEMTDMSGKSSSNQHSPVRRSVQTGHNGPMDIEMTDMSAKGKRMADIHREIGQGMSPVAGEASDSRTLAHAMLDVRFNYQVDRSVDQANMFKRAKESGKQKYKETDVAREAAKAGGKAVVSHVVPFGTNIMAGVDAGLAQRDVEKLKADRQQHADAMKPVFDNLIDKKESDRNLSAVKAFDPTPHSLIAKTATLAKGVKDLITDDSRKSRINAAAWAKSLQTPRPNHLSEQEHRQQQHELASKRNTDLAYLAKSDPKASRALISLVDSAITPTFHSTSQELAHHNQVLRQHHAESARQEHNGVDTSHTLRPSMIKQQIQSEKALRALKVPGGR